MGVRLFEYNRVANNHKLEFVVKNEAQTKLMQKKKKKRAFFQSKHSVKIFPILTR